MGKLLEILRHPESRRSAFVETSPAPPPVVLAEIGPKVEEAEADDVSFIEIGPCREVLGSPDVLAFSPTPYRPGLAVHAPLTAALAPSPVAQVALPSVAFRPIPTGPRFGNELIAYHDPSHPVSAQYRDLYASLTTALGPDRPRVLLLTSALPGTESAPVLLNLAITAARQGRRRVAVVDGNGREPHLSRLLGLPEVPGLREVLSGTASLEQAVQATEQENLFALTAGTATATQAVRWVAETIRSLLRQLRHRYDLVLVDAPRWDGNAEVASLGSACDAVYLVVPDKEANSPELDELFQVIPEQGSRLAGCIVAG